jgi:HK97 family phage prohead protease
MTNIEKRGALLGVEVRADGEKRTLVGYAAVFNSDTTIGDWWIERIDPHAFDGTLSGDVRALVDHDTGRVVGRTKSGTLRLAVDDRGLKAEIDVPNTTDGNDLWELVERGDISGMSFGFRVTKQEWDETGDMPIRTILEVELFEVSAVAFPAYDDTELGKRSLQEWRDAHAIEQPLPTKDSPAQPVSRAAPNIRARLSMDLDLRVRTTR